MTRALDTIDEPERTCLRRRSSRAGMRDAIFKGPMGLPEVRNPDGTEAGILGGVLRKGLDLYANVLPIRLFPEVNSALAGRKAGDIDYVIVRENTEGAVFSRGQGEVTPEGVRDIISITRAGTERIVRHAFELARKRSGAPQDSVKRVTCIDKSNVLRGFVLFRHVFLEIGEHYPDIEKDCLYADAAAQALVLWPERFSVIVCENFLGDIFSDLARHCRRSRLLWRRNRRHTRHVRDHA